MEHTLDNSSKIPLNSSDAYVDTFVSYETLQIMKIVMYVFIVAIISFCGIIFNIINIIVFTKMGFKDPVNIPLMSLAISDTGSLLPLLWMGLCYNPLLASQFPRLDFAGIQHLTAGIPHVIFSRITSWLTVLVTFERYLCVAFPLKVKTLVTRRRTVVTVIFIFILMMAGMVPLYRCSALGPLYRPDLNRTVITVVYITNNAHDLENASTTFNTTAQLLAFVSVVICTLGLVHKIQSKSKWRNTTSTASKNETTSTRGRKVVKMIICIAVIFSVIYFPFVVGMIAMLIFPEYSFMGRYANLFHLSWMFFFCLETINSSVNIFVYLKMSSKYREVFMDLFRLSPSRSKNVP